MSQIKKSTYFINAFVLRGGDLCINEGAPFDGKNQVKLSGTMAYFAENELIEFSHCTYPAGHIFYVSRSVGVGIGEIK